MEVCLLQELLAVGGVGDAGEEDQGGHGSQDEPEAGRVGPQPVDQPAGGLVVRQGHVHGQAVHDGVDLEVDGHPQGDAGQKVNPLLQRKQHLHYSDC